MNAIQIFGMKKNADVRKALRFFGERRVQTHFVDFKVRAPSRGELKRFVQKFGVDALIDRNARRFRDLGLGAARYTEDRWIEMLSDEPGIILQPLVRNGNQLTVGDGTEAWKTWVE